MVIKRTAEVIIIGAGVIGTSIAYGSTSNGSLENAYQLDYRTPNAKYFSPISYYLMDNAFVNSKVYNTVFDAYKECESTCEGTKFRFMECSGEKGGRILIHRTHRNGLSVDFMVPKIKSGKQYKWYDRLGLWHYLLNFDSNGNLIGDKKVSIDFNPQFSNASLKLFKSLGLNLKCRYKS